MAYIDEAVYNGAIEDNYNYLIKSQPYKSRFIIKHLPILREYAKKCEHITEFGVDAVNSTWALLSGKPKIMVSVDPSDKKAPKIHKLALELAEKEGIDYKFINDYSTNIEKIDETDLLFIDSVHTYKCLSMELKLHSPQVKKYIILHDMNMDELKRAVKDILNLSEIGGFFKDESDWDLIYRTQKNEGLWILERKIVE